MNNKLCDEILKKEEKSLQLLHVTVSSCLHYSTGTSILFKLTMPSPQDYKVSSDNDSMPASSSSANNESLPLFEAHSTNTTATATTTSSTTPFPIPPNLLPRCRRVYVWTQSFALHALQGYVDFMSLKNEWNGKNAVATPLIIKKVWQQHLLDHDDYTRACQVFCGKRIPHDPDEEMNQEDRQASIAETISVAKLKLGGNLKADIWSYVPEFPGEDSGDCSSDSKPGAHKGHRQSFEYGQHRQPSSRSRPQEEPGTTPLTVFARRYFSANRNHQNGMVHDLQHNNVADQNNNDNNKNNINPPGHDPNYIDLYFKILPTTRMGRILKYKSM